MKENNNDKRNLIETQSKIDSGTEKTDREKTTLSDWQMYKLAISGVAFTLTMQEDLHSVITTAQEDFQRFAYFYALRELHSGLCLEKTYSYEVFFRGPQPLKGNNYEKNEFIRDCLHRIRMIAKRLHRVLQIMINYCDYFFLQGSSSLSLHFEALETGSGNNTICVDFHRDLLDDHIDKKRIVSRYQTLSFYDYNYFYQDEAPDETAVDFWLAMDRFLEEPYLTQEDMKKNGCKPDEEMCAKNVKNKDRLRNYVHKIMIVPDELLNDNEKKFREWVRNSDNQKKFVAVYEKTFNRVSKTGLKKIEGNIKNQKEIINSKLLFCKQKMSFENLDGKTEEKFVYSLKLLKDGEWIEYPKCKYAKYYKVDLYNSQHGGCDTKTLKYESNYSEETYAFPNMEYLTYLLHANLKKLSEIEREFVNAFLDRSKSGIFSLGVQMHQEKVKQYVHDNLITGRENWNLEESGLSDQDIKILNILNDDDRINRFNESVEEIYNADLVKNLWDKAQEELKAENKINDFDDPTDQPEQYDIAKEMYKTLQICKEQEIKDKNKLPVTITFNWFKFFKGLVITFTLSLVIFVALKFIFDVVAIWALIIFPVVPVLIFFACVFFLKNKFRKIIYPCKIYTLENENEKESIFSKSEIENQKEEEIEKIGDTRKSGKQYETK